MYKLWFFCSNKLFIYLKRNLQIYFQHLRLFVSVAVVVAFFICWAPFHAQRLLAIYGAPTSTHMITAFGVMTYISGILYYVSTTINPLLYHIISNKFREAFKVTQLTKFYYKLNRVSLEYFKTNISAFLLNKQQLLNNSNYAVPHYPHQVHGYTLGNWNNN